MHSVNLHYSLTHRADKPAGADAPLLRHPLMDLLQAVSLKELDFSVALSALRVLFHELQQHLAALSSERFSHV